MANQRIIHIVGLSDEDAAHLRLLMRATRKQVRDLWAFGSEAKADLVVVNQRRLVGDSARRRALQRQIACAQVLEVGDQKTAGQFLRKPFQREVFVNLLNSVGRDDAVDLESDDMFDDFAELDLGFADLSVLEADHPGGPDVLAQRVNGHDMRAAAAELSVYDQPPDLSQLPPSSPPEKRAYASQATGAATSGATSDSPARANGSDVRVEQVPAAPAVIEEAEPVPANSSHPLIDYIGKNLLRAPSRITLLGAVPLVIDPEQQVYLAQGGLNALEPYARHPLRYGDWQRLNPADLDALRRSSFCKPVANLIWMSSFINSNGFLSRKFDQTGMFSLTGRLNLSQDYPRAYRIGSQMTTPKRLHEIARLATVDIDEVFNVINAYDVLCFVEGTLRKK